MTGHHHTLESLFDVPGERFTVDTAIEPAALLEFLEESEQLEIDGRLLDRIRAANFPENRVPHLVTSLSVRSPTTLQVAKKVLVRAEMAVWAFAYLLHAAVADTKAAIERDGHQNIAWIPDPVVLYWEANDGRLHARFCSGTSLERYARVLV